MRGADGLAVASGEGAAWLATGGGDRGRGWGARGNGLEASPNEPDLPRVRFAFLVRFVLVFVLLVAHVSAGEINA